MNEPVDNPQESLIEAEHLTKLYGSVIGANDVHVVLEPGSYGLVGPNGSGKTTLLNLITGQLLPSIGRVRTLGRNPWNNPRVFRELGLAPATEIPYVTVTAFEWVVHLVRMSGFGSAEAQRRAGDALDRVGLAEAMHQPMGTYSRGMRQRAKLAQAFAHEPRLLILDEPFNGLDPIARHDIMKRLRAWSDEGRSLILASHVLHEVEAVCDSFLLIYGGRLLASGNATEVRGLMAEVPQEIVLRSHEPRRLAAKLIDQEHVETVKFASDGGGVAIGTSRPGEVFGALPEWIREDGLSVSEISTPEETLQFLFDSLLRQHTGEAP